MEIFQAYYYYYYYCNVACYITLFFYVLPLISPLFSTFVRTLTEKLFNLELPIFNTLKFIPFLTSLYFLVTKNRSTLVLRGLQFCET
jgi:hypothetical protein